MNVDTIPEDLLEGRVQDLSPAGDRKSSLLDEISCDFYRRTGVDLREEIN